MKGRFTPPISSLPSTHGVSFATSASLRRHGKLPERSLAPQSPSARIVSITVVISRGDVKREKRKATEGTDDDFESEDDDCSDEENEDGEMDEASGDDEEEDGGDNQVVPWSSVPPPPPPPVASSSISKEVSSSASKRTREAADLDSEDEIGSISSRFNHNIASMATSSRVLENDEANFSSSRTSLKLRRPNESIQSEGDKDHDKLGSRSVAMMVSSLKKLQRNTISDDDEASAIVLGICRLSRDPTEF
ncbi:B-box type zinc finger family protein [Actinidia rufa]|uniref:B-box type zinc finger family protein n=1 Tax=Actinidia rufa TaxID=165716 RepID=A0A7J0G6Y3_9ERIC|nr:B-box type zinc finger family protein [Actinidia rufa]